MIRLTFLLLLLGWAVLLSGSPTATAQSPATEGSSQPTYVEAIKKRAQDGDAGAQFSLGVMHKTGDGVPKDATEAAKWFRRAAEQGNADAQCSLGLAYRIGEGVTEDAAEAVTWFRRAAEQGNAAGQCYLGSAYRFGAGVTKDAAEAVTWFRRAAEHRFAPAQYFLGAVYLTGEGVLRDDTEAAKWYRLAAEQGLAEAQFGLGAMYSNGVGVVLDHTEAAKWFRLAAEQGLANAQFNVGHIYFNGSGVPQNDTEAVKWFRLAAEQGLAEAQAGLGYIYSSGNGVPKDDAEAVKWYRLAAEQGHAGAQGSLGARYFLGEGVPTSYIWGYAWTSLAAASGNDHARGLRDLFTEQMTREQIAEAQKIAAEFKPKLRNPVEAQKSPVAAPRAAVTGSGFFVTADGYFVTNHHVVADAVSVRVRTTAGTFPATVIRTDPTNDIAILEVVGEFNALAVRGSRGVKIADRVATLGFPNPDLQGEAAKYGSGEVAALSGPADDPRFLQISVPIQPGNSGGPLVDSSGAVVGVVVSQLDKIATFKLTGNIPENVNYAIKGTILLGVLESVPGLAEKVRTEPVKPAADAAEVAKALEAACGLVLVEK